MSEPVCEAADWLKIAESAALLAGHYLKHERSAWAVVESHAAHDVKVKADRMSEKIILETLSRTGNLPVFSEETARADSVTEENDDALLWVVDPLDGSLNYNQGIPFSCVSIALCQGNKPVVGVVYDFNRDELFSGIAGNGAWCNRSPLTMFSRDDLQGRASAVLCTGVPVNADFSDLALKDFVRRFQSYKKVRLFGSAALSLCYVACGRTDVYYEKDIMFWDVAAGCAVVSGAGGDLYCDAPDGIARPVTVLAGEKQSG